MNEAVDRVLEQREALDRGFPAGVMLSGLFHLLLVGAALGAAWLGSRPPLVRVATGIAVPLPPGGGGPPAPEPAPAAAPPASRPPAPEPAAPEPPPRVIKPPKEEPKKGLPPPDAKKTRRKPEPERSVAPARGPAPSPDPRRASGSGATGTNPATPGLGIIGPAGPGVPHGTDPLGDWYLAGVQRKIWLIWTRQVKTNFSQPIRVSFTITADGRLEDGSVQVVQPSGVQLLDFAAQRAVTSAAPFSPLPRTYGTNRITIQALFQPTP